MNLWQADGIEYVNYTSTLDGDRACTAQLPLPGYAFSLLRTAPKPDNTIATLQTFACGPPYCTSAVSAAGCIELHMRLTSYFEITLHAPLEEHANTAAGTCVAIGAGSARFPLLGRMPGWDAQSFGWHSDDGKRFHRSGVGQPFGPAYGVGDTVGCGIDFSDTLPRSSSCPPQLGRGKVFYTLNGQLVGYAFTGVDVSEPQWPLVGIDTPHPVSVNFGANMQHQPFAFDLGAFEARLWAAVRPSRRRSQSAAEAAASAKPAQSTHTTDCMVAHLRTSLAARRRMCLTMRSGACRAALHAKVRDAAAAAGALNRDIGALRTPVLFPVPGQDYLSRTIATHAKHWRLVDTEPVPMSDLLLSWMLRNLRRQREEAPQAAGGGGEPTAAPLDVTHDVLAATVEPAQAAATDWGGSVSHAIGALGVELPPGQPLPLGTGAAFVMRSRSRAQPAHDIGDGAALSPSDTVDSDHGWWSDGSEHLELLDGGHISILSDTVAPARPQLYVGQGGPPGGPAKSASMLPVSLPAQLGLGHLQTHAAATAPQHSTRGHAPAPAPLSPRSMASALRGPVRCSFE